MMAPCGPEVPDPSRPPVTCTLVAPPPTQVEALVREHWRGRSARSAVGSNDKGMGRSIGHLALTRWDAARPATPGNLVLLTREEADTHDALTAAGSAEERERVRPGEGAGALDAVRALRMREPAFCASVEAVLGRTQEQFGC